MVKTSAKKNLKEFYNQRKRWISKTKIYTDFNISYIGVINLFTNFFIIILATLYFIDNKNLIYFITFTLFKFLIDIIFFAITNKIYKIKNLYSLFIFTEILYPFYILIMFITGFFGNYKWKERKYKI